MDCCPVCHVVTCVCRRSSGGALPARRPAHNCKSPLNVLVGRRPSGKDFLKQLFQTHGGSPMKSLIFAFCVVLTFGDLNAQTNLWQPSSGHTQVPIWPGAAPDAQAQSLPGPEYATNTLTAARQALTRVV